MGEENKSKLYWYRVRACNAGGCGPESTPAVGYAGTPPPPTGLQATRDLTDKIVITWEPVPGATHYQVNRDAARDGTYEHTVAEEATTTSSEDTSVLSGRRYWYMVRTCSDQGCGPLSEPVYGCRSACPPGS